MKRCIELARLGSGFCSPNPLVGAVLVHKNRIIGEGWHKEYGGSHAEVNCLGSVKENDRQYIAESELYVSLEPCAHFGKTPPCTDLIIKNKIKKVFIGCPDPFLLVNGRGVEILRSAGVRLEENILKDECRNLNRSFFCFHEKHRPYIILKWAETSDHFIATSDDQRLLITNELTNRLVHKWRSETDAILVGTSTAHKDNPELTNRLYKGRSPVRLVVDIDLSLPSSLKVFSGATRTIIFNTKKHKEAGNLFWYQVTNDVSLPVQIVNALHQLNIQSLIVEGGAKLLQSFLDDGLWDEVRVIRNTELIIRKGLPAPVLSTKKSPCVEEYGSDRIEYYSGVS